MQRAPWTAKEARTQLACINQIPLSFEKETYVQ